MTISILKDPIWSYLRFQIKTRLSSEQAISIDPS